MRKVVTPGLLIITAVFIVSFLLMLPLRNQGYDDDFAYIQTVKSLVGTGELKLSEWSAVSLVFQVYWGTLFTKIFGFSIKALHLSNLVLLFIASLFFFRTLKKLDLDETRATAFTLFLLASPWIFMLSYTFMSDVFYMSLLIISIFFFVSGFKERRILPFLFGSLVSSLAFLTRQIGIVIAASALTSLVISSFVRKERASLRLLLAVALPAAIVAFAYFLWAAQTGPTVAQYKNVILPLKEEILPTILPFNLGHVGITNTLYTETLVQRTLGYVNAIVPTLAPILLVFPFGLATLFSFVKKNARLILSSFVLLFIFYFVDSFLGSKFTYPPPSQITRNNPFFDLTLAWPILNFIFVPVFAVVAGMSIIFFTKNSLSPKNQKYKKFSGVFLTVGAASILFLFLKVIEKSYPAIPLFSPKNYPNIYSHLNVAAHIGGIIFSERIIEIAKNSFFFFTLLALVLKIAALLLFELKITVSKRLTGVHFFLIFLFIAHFVGTVFLTKYFWHNYIIPLIPFLLIWIACTFRNRKIRVPNAVLVIAFLFAISFSQTKERYQEVGVRWELGTKLVETGIDPYNISEASWAWRPYWYFESTFAEATQNVGGDKYKVPNFTNWLWGTPEMGDLYEFLEIPEKEALAVEKGQIVRISDSFWTLKGRRRVAVIRLSQEEK